MTTNRGFVFEDGDPSVGLFGHYWSHDDCLVTDCEPDPADFEVDEQQIAVTRTTPWTVRTWYLLTCRDCGMQALVNEDDYSPTNEALVEMDRAEYEAAEAERAHSRAADLAEAEAEAMLAQFDDDPSPYAGTYSET